MGEGKLLGRELRIEVPALTCPKVGETIDIAAAKSALWALACP